MKTIRIGSNVISETSPCYVIAEIGHNHQGDIDIACKMIQIAAECGVQAVKFQKRNNKTLFTKALYESPYDNENSYGATYGEHREYLEFDYEQFMRLKKCAEAHSVDFMCTAFDFESVDFLEKLGIESYKIASGDITNTPLLTYVAKLGKPMIVSTGACTMDDVRIAYNTMLPLNNQICLLHCTAAYPAEYTQLNLGVIKTFKKEFPEAIIGYSGHDNGILAAVIARMLGATVIEKHFTLNRALKGTDHKFSLEPEGLRKQVRDLKRIHESLGTSEKILYDFEKNARKKMGKGIYTKKKLSAGKKLTIDDVCFKSPTTDLPPNKINEIIGKILKVDLEEEVPLSREHLV